MWQSTSYIYCCLQKREIDIKKAYQQVDFVKNSLITSRRKIDSIHHELFARAKVMAEYVGEAPSKPRTCKRQLHRNNPETVNIEEYFRTSITIPFLEHVISEIDTRFGNAPATVIKGFSIIPEFFVNSINKKWKEDFEEFARVYQGDLPGLNSISPELLMWETYWNQYKGDLPSSIAETLAKVHDMRLSFPNIYSALRVMATVPVTSCECERNVSTLRRLKTYL